MNNMINRTFWRAACVVIIFLSYSCAAQKNNGKPYYHEDLNSLRPKTAEISDTAEAAPAVYKKGEVIPVYNVNKKVDAVLDSINRYNVSRRIIEGYTIQIYSGQNQNDAVTTKRKAALEAGDLIADMEYNQPKFRVKVGGYYSRLEAQRDLLRLKRIFPNAILVPEKIAVK